MEAQLLWQNLQQGDDLARDRLVEDNLPLVHYLARKLMKRLQNDDVEFDDLISAGSCGLIAAVDNFDPSRGLAFSTFAAPRIRGAMLDQLRSWDHASRSVRRRQRELAQTRERFSADHGRAPTGGETADALGIDMETYWSWEADVASSSRVALDAPISRDGTNAQTPRDTLAGSDADDIEGGLDHEQQVEILKHAIAGLPERERTVLSLYYFEELKMHQIADILGVTESRISQIRSKALKVLRAELSYLHEDA